MRQHAVVSTRYTMLNVLHHQGRTGLKPMGLNGAPASPIANVFDPAQGAWIFNIVASDVLKPRQLPIPDSAYAAGVAIDAGCPSRSAGYWAAAMRGQDFRLEDRLDTDAFSAHCGGAVACACARDLRRRRPEARPGGAAAACRYEGDVPEIATCCFLFLPALRGGGPRRICAVVVGCTFRDNTQSHAPNTIRRFIRIAINLRCWDTVCLDAVVRQPAVTDVISIRIMHGAVDFEAKPCFRTVEVQEIGPDGMLTAEDYP